MENLEFVDYYNAYTGSGDLVAGKWYINYNKRHAFKICKERDALDNNQLVVQQSENVTRVVTDFNDIVTSLNNTKIVSNDDGTNQIELELPDRIEIRKSQVVQTEVKTEDKKEAEKKPKRTRKKKETKVEEKKEVKGENVEAKKE